GTPPALVLSQDQTLRRMVSPVARQTYGEEPKTALCLRKATNNKDQRLHRLPLSVAQFKSTGARTPNRYPVVKDQT
ncbi:MAG: hypothetical protein AB1758_36985, partial [Candidatus Eremiobacterota bacterium]